MQLALCRCRVGRVHLLLQRMSERLKTLIGIGKSRARGAQIGQDLGLPRPRRRFQDPDRLVDGGRVALLGKLDQRKRAMDGGRVIVKRRLRVGRFDGDQARGDRKPGCKPAGAEQDYAGAGPVCRAS